MEKLTENKPLIMVMVLMVNEIPTCQMYNKVISTEIKAYLQVDYKYYDTIKLLAQEQNNIIKSHLNITATTIYDQY